MIKQLEDVNDFFCVISLKPHVGDLKMLRRNEKSCPSGLVDVKKDRDGFLTSSCNPDMAVKLFCGFAIL